MGASFGVVGRSQLAGYAGTAGGILRSRIHPLVPIAAIDLLAVAVALGAMNLVGTIVGGQRGNPFLSAIDQTKDDLVTFAAKAQVAPAPAPVVAKTVQAVAPKAKVPQVVVFAAMPDSELLFGQPVLIGGPFESGQGDTVRFICPEDVVAGSGNEPTPGTTRGEETPPTDVAVIEEPPLLEPEVVDEDPVSPPAAKIASIAGQTQTRALELADEAVVFPLMKVVDDVVPLKKNSNASSGTTTSAKAVVDSAGAAVTSAASAAVPAVSKAAHTVTATVAAPVVQAAAAPVQAAAAPVQTIAAPVVQSVASPAQQVVQSVAQPVTQVVGGLLN
jgi:hypothetical protein